MNKLILVAFVALFLSVSSNVFAQSDSRFQLIHTNGAAEKYIDPNMVVVSVETFGLGELAKVAQERQAAEYQRLKAVVEKFKIKKDDFLTENMNLSPQYRYDEKTQSNKTIGFRVSHQIRIVLRQKNDAGNFLDAISSAAKADKSGLTINSISWDNDQRKKMSEGLIAEAVADAKAKADRLASAAGVKIKAVQNIQYYDSSPGPVMRDYSASAKMTFAAERVPTELGSGLIKIRTEVNMQYRIE